MEEMNTVLAAIDLETGHDAVLARAALLVGARAARLLVLHVIEAEPLSRAAVHLNLDESELRERLKRQAIATIEPLIAASGLARQTDLRVEFGSPHQIISDVARERRADVAVIGPGKGDTFKDRILGSTADRVLRASAAPVLVVRKASAKPYRSVAVAVDGSPQSAGAFIEARRLAPEAALQLVHVVDIPLQFQQAMLRAGTSQVEMELYRAARAARAREELAAFERDILGTVALPVHVLHGAPGPALVRFSKDSRVDLLAMGSHGRGAAMQALLGSVARRVLGEAACDVLVTSVPQ